MTTSNTFEGTLSLYRCYGCTFEIVRKPGELVGNYRLTQLTTHRELPSKN